VAGYGFCLRQRLRRAGRLTRLTCCQLTYSPAAFIDQLPRRHNADRAVGDEVTPHPMVMRNYACCIQMGPIAYRVTVADNNDVMIVRNGQ
jgi:hypothetical protein